MSADAPRHLGIAEQGKLLAVGGDHHGALRHYREAMRLAVADGAPELFFRHYLECSVESLERLESYDEVLDYCGRAIALYQEQPPAHALARRDLAHLYLRRGAVLLKRGETAEAAEALDAALAIEALPLARSLRRWISANYHLTTARISAEQERHGYFSVRAATVARDRAIPLPDTLPAR